MYCIYMTMTLKTLRSMKTCIKHHFICTCENIINTKVQQSLQVFLQFCFMQVTYSPALQNPFFPQVPQSENICFEGKSMEMMIIHSHLCSYLCSFLLHQMNMSCRLSCSRCPCTPGSSCTPLSWPRYHTTARILTNQKREFILSTNQK